MLCINDLGISISHDLVTSLVIPLLQILLRSSDLAYCEVTSLLDVCVGGCKTLSRRNHTDPTSLEVCETYSKSQNPPYSFIISFSGD